MQFIFCCGNETEAKSLSSPSTTLFSSSSSRSFSSAFSPSSSSCSPSSDFAVATATGNMFLDDHPRAARHIDLLPADPSALSWLRSVEKPLPVQCLHPWRRRYRKQQLLKPFPRETLLKVCDESRKCWKKCDKCKRGLTDGLEVQEMLRMRDGSWLLAKMILAVPREGFVRMAGSW